MPGNPARNLKPWKYALYDRDERIDTLTFYAKNRAGADRHAIAWAKSKGQTVRRIKTRESR